MPNYNDAQGVADLLSQFDFNIISEARVTSRPSIASTPASSANPVSSPSPPRISATLASTVSRPRRTCSPRWRATRSRSMAYS